MTGTITRQIQEEAVAYIQKNIKVSSADCLDAIERLEITEIPAGSSLDGSYGGGCDDGGCQNDASCRIQHPIPDHCRRVCTDHIGRTVGWMAGSLLAPRLF